MFGCKTKKSRAALPNSRIVSISRRLLKFITSDFKIFLENQYKGRAEVKSEWLLEDFNKGLIILSGALQGEIGQLILNDKVKEASEVALNGKKNLVTVFI